MLSEEQSSVSKLEAGFIENITEMGDVAQTNLKAHWPLRTPKKKMGAELEKHKTGNRPSSDAKVLNLLDECDKLIGDFHHTYNRAKNSPA